MENNNPVKIALVACPYNSNDYMTRGDIAVDDLGLGYLYSALENNGFNVSLFDSLRSEPSFESPVEVLKREILQCDPD